MTRNMTPASFDLRQTARRYVDGDLRWSRRRTLVFIVVFNVAAWAIAAAWLLS